MSAHKEPPQEWWLRSSDPTKFALALEQCRERGLLSHCHEDGFCRTGQCFGPFRARFEIVIFYDSQKPPFMVIGADARKELDDLHTHLALLHRETEEPEIARRLLTGGAACAHVVEADDLNAAKMAASKAHARCMLAEIEHPRRQMYLDTIRRRQINGPSTSTRCIVCNGKLKSKRSREAHVGKECARKYGIPF